MTMRPASTRRVWQQSIRYANVIEERLTYQPEDTIWGTREDNTKNQREEGAKDRGLIDGPSGECEARIRNPNVNEP